MAATLEAEAKILGKEKVFRQEATTKQEELLTQIFLQFESLEDERIENDELRKRTLIVLIIIKRS